MFDQDKADALTEAIANALRPVGVTIAPEAVAYTLSQGQVVVQMMGLVRDSAGQAIGQQSLQDKQTLNEMLANQAEEQRRKQVEEIRDLASDPDKLAAFLFNEEDECDHEMHEGLCLKCNYEEDDDDSSTG
jgi:hypothetical protein